MKLRMLSTLLDKVLLLALDQRQLLGLLLLLLRVAGPCQQQQHRRSDKQPPRAEEDLLPHRVSLQEDRSVKRQVLDLVCVTIFARLRIASRIAPYL